ncbi:MAG: hypothetical protein H6573_34335 [Lewinellaceae bacterium]|nr:hypothetical protein [Lewinellaceae bacterium]
MDTYKIVRLLQDKGYSQEEAEGFIQAVQEITLTGVATRQDITNVRKEVADLRAELKTDIAALRTDLKTDIAEVRTDLYKFMFLNSIGIVGLTVTLIKLLG